MNGRCSLSERGSSSQRISWRKKTIADRNRRQSEGRQLLASFPMWDVVPWSSDRKDETRIVEEWRYPAFAMRRLRCLPPGSISGEEGKEEN